MPYGPTPRLGLVAPLGSEQINQGDDKFRALIDQLDAVLAPFSFGLLSARPTSTSGSPGIQGRRYRATDAFTTFRDTGTSWEIESQTPQVVTTLPTGTGIPFDGQEIYFLADATNGIVWHLRYRAAATGAYKWEIVGSGVLYNEVQTAQSPPASYGDMTTVGPQVTVPLAGDYEIAWGGKANTVGVPGYCKMAPAIGAVAASDAVDVEWSTTTGQAVYNWQSASRTYKATAVPASSVIVAKYMNSGGATVIGSRWLSVTPIRVG